MAEGTKMVPSVDTIEQPRKMGKQPSTGAEECTTCFATYFRFFL